MARKKSKQTPVEVRGTPSGPVSRPMKTTEEQRLAHLADRAKRSRPVKTTEAERLAYRGRPQPKSSTGLVERKGIEASLAERGSILKAAVKFRNRPTKASFGHLSTLVGALSDRPEVDLNEKTAEQMAFERKQARDKDSKRDAIKAEIAEREALLSDVEEPSADSGDSEGTSAEDIAEREALLSDVEEPSADSGDSEGASAEDSGGG